MCYVYDNPKGLMNHVDDLLTVVEESADEDEMRRIIESLDYHVYDGDLNGPEYENKRNQIFKAIVSFVKLLRDREDARLHKEELERKRLAGCADFVEHLKKLKNGKQEDLIEGDEAMGQQTA